MRKTIVFLSMVLTALSCNSDLQDDVIPLTPFDEIQLNMTLPSYSTLLSTGGYKTINTGGIRGIILYRISTSSVVAFERNCSYQPLNACATVDIHSSGLYMHDACCGSSFRWDDGTPTGGPAWRPLVQYATNLNGSVLTITDQVIN
jgi:hypothetical protein